MPIIFSTGLVMSPVAWVLTVISVIGFLVMFGIASLKGDYQGLSKSILENDRLKRTQSQLKK